MAGSGAADHERSPSYFFIAVSTAENLARCREYGLAGFPDSQNGAWTFADVEVGDYVTFVYGATAYDLYRVADRRAISDAEDTPPWPALEFDRGGSYHFPFRLDLDPERELEENLVRSEFRYIAENLMLRGGYSRTHFQADRTTLQQVSQMGTVRTAVGRERDWTTESIEPRWVRSRAGFEPPRVNKFKEELLHVLLRRRWSTADGLGSFVDGTGFDQLLDRSVEVLGERALPEGHLDLLLKDAEPVGEALQIPVEVKLNRCSGDGIEQLVGYVEQLEPECPGGVLIAETIPRNLEVPENVALLRASFDGLDMGEPRTLPEMQRHLAVEPVSR